MSLKAGRKGLGSGFSRAGVSYDGSSSVQRQIALELVTCLACEFKSSRILDLGSGTGFLADLLTKRYLGSHVIAVDLALGMLRQVENGDNLSRVCADFSQPLFRPQVFDLVVSSSALHWVKELGSVFDVLAELLKPGGEFVAAMMIEGTLAGLRQKRQELFPARGLYQSLPSQLEVVAGLENAGFSLRYLEAKSYIKFYSSGWALFQELNRAGVSSGAISKALSRKELNHLAQSLEADYPKGIPLNYEVLMFKAKIL